MAAQAAPCGGWKQSHATLRKAERHLRRLMKRGPYRGHVYRCRQCGGYHVGRAERRARGP